jgi:glycosyltransferase involved in cell wall biosynthesis
MTPPALLDATPLAGGHAARGIGTAVRGLIAGLATLPAEERPVLLVRHSQEVPHGFHARTVRWPLWPLHRAPDPWPVVLGERTARRLAAGGVFHAVQPALVPSGRTVVTCHDLIPSFFPEYLAGVGRAGQALAYRHFLRRLAGAQLVLTPSHETADDVVAQVGVDPARVRVVPWGPPEPATPLGPAPEGPYVLYAGAIEPHKNAALAVEAIARTRPGIRLVMTGTWSARRLERLRTAAERAGAGGRVDWMGLVSPERLAAVRAAALAALVPSRKEGFGLPVLEAMAAGVPVLASDTPALREVGGDAPIFLPANDPSAWTEAIATLASDPAMREAHAKAGLRRAGTFSWRRTAEAVAAAHREAAT